MSRPLLSIYDPKELANRKAFPCSSSYVIAAVALHAALVAAVAILYRPVAFHRAPPTYVENELVFIAFPDIEASAPLAGPAAVVPLQVGVVVGDADFPGSVSVPSTDADFVAGGASVVASEPASPAALPAAEPGAPLHAHIPGDALAALRAFEDSVEAEKQRDREARQVVVLGQRVTVFGDEIQSRMKFLAMPLFGGIQTMPEDGKRWEEHQLDVQRDGFVRDSVLRERNRAMRERADRERASR